MWGILLTGLVGVSALLCVATCAAWVRSRYVGDEFYWENWRYAAGVGFRTDALYVWQARVQVPVPPDRQFRWTFTHEAQPPRGESGRLRTMQHSTFLGAIHQFGTGPETDGYSYYHDDFFLPW